MSETNFREAEHALKTRPSVFREREREVLSLWFGLVGESPMSIPEIGKKLHITKSRVRTHLDRAINLVRLVIDDPYNTTHDSKPKGMP